MYDIRVLDMVDFVYEDEQIFFIAPCLPAIWRYDCSKGMTTILVDFTESINAKGSFVRLMKIKQKIYCIPCFANNIYCYNLDTGQFYSLNIPEEIFQQMPERKIIEAISLNSNLYCVCRSPHIIIDINTENDTYQIYRLKDIEQEHNFFTIKNNKEVIAYPFLQNQLICFDTKNKEIFFKKLYESIEDTCPEEKWIYNFEYDDMGGIWFCNFIGEVYRVIDGKIDQIKMPDNFIGYYHDSVGRKRPGINGMEYMDGNICFILASDYRILQYNLSENKFIWSGEPSDECFRNEEIYFHYNSIKENGLLLYGRDTNSFYVWDKEKGFTDKFAIMLSADILAQNRVLQSYVNLERESDNINLQFYLEFVKQLKDGEKNSVGMEEKIGKKIYISSHYFGGL